MLKLTKKLFSRSKYSQFLGPRGPLMCSTFDSCPRFVPKILKNWQQEVLPIFNILLIAMPCAEEMQIEIFLTWQYLHHQVYSLFNIFDSPVLRSSSTGSLLSPFTILSLRKSYGQAGLVIQRSILYLTCKLTISLIVSGGRC